jgi:membrane fusion protein (multidrug efflux system)
VLSDGSVYAHEGRVTTVDRNIDPTTGTIGIESLFPNPEQLLRPGQFGRVRAVVTTQEDAVVVPQRAVRELQGSYTIAVVLPDSTLETRTVTAGERSGSDWVITEGLEAGELIVLEGAERVRPGMKVRAVQATDG